MMTAIYIAVVGVLQVLMLYVIERVGLIARIRKNIFYDKTKDHSSISCFFDADHDPQHDRANDVLRINETASAVVTNGISLFATGVTALAIGVLGTRMNQDRAWAVDGSYLAAALCVMALITLLVFVASRNVYDYPKWKSIPHSKLIRAFRKAVSLRTPGPYRVVLLTTSIFVLCASAFYR